MLLTERIYAYFWQGRGNNSNSYLLTGEKNILIDPGHMVNEAGERCLEKLSAQMLADGNSLEQVDLIVCTHAHPDHCSAAETVKEKSGARLALHQEDAKLWDYWKKHLSSSGSRLGSLDPDFYLQEGELEVGVENPEQLQVIFTPGHSPGSICLYDSREMVLFTGDTIFRGSIGRTDLPGGSMEEMTKSVQKLFSLEEVHLLLPGHMGPVEGKEMVQNNLRAIWKYFFER